MRVVFEQTGGLGRWLISLALMGLIVVGSFLAIASFFPGETFLDRLEAAYNALLNRTTQRQFTEIMRENPLWLIIPGIGLIVLAGWQLHRRHWSRALLVYIAFGIGFVAGHVFW